MITIGMKLRNKLKQLLYMNKLNAKEIIEKLYQLGIHPNKVADGKFPTNTVVTTSIYSESIKDLQSKMDKMYPTPSDREKDYVNYVNLKESLDILIKHHNKALASNTNVLEGLGKVEFKEQSLDNTIRNDQEYIILYFVEHDVYLMVDAEYNSYSGTDFGTTWYEAIPKETTIYQYT
jgi:hypothetical protein